MSIDGSDMAGAGKAGTKVDPPSANTELSDVLVPPAMLAVATALGTAFYLHLGLAPELAAALGLAIFCVMLLGHVLFRPGAGAALRDEPRRSATSAVAQGPRVAKGVRRPVAAKDGRPAKPSQAQSMQPPAHAGHHVQDGPPLEASITAQLAEARAKPAPGGWRFRPVDLDLPTVVEDARPDVAIETAAAQLRPTYADDGLAQSPAQTATPPVSPAQDAAPIGEPLSEKERVEHILQRLATQIMAGTSFAGPQEPTAETEAATQPAQAAVSGGPDIAPSLSPGLPPLPQGDTALQSAVDALRATVDAMRAGGRPSGPQENPQGPATALPTPAELRVAAIAEALAAERADVYVDPILALAEGNARHFEISVRLRAADGEMLGRDRVKAEARGAGLLPVLDALGIRHSAGFALKLERLGREGTVMSPVAGESLISRGFVSDIAGRNAQGIADRLVLAFDQAELSMLGSAQLGLLSQLNELGFRFALEGLANLDLDLDGLANVGFEFVKLDAHVFANGLPLAGATVPPSDLARYLEDHGLTVIAGHIEDEAARARMLEYGVALGQGGLFGMPRPVPVATPAAVAA